MDVTSMALVARTGVNGLEYLCTPRGQVTWSASSNGAVRFPTVREATRAALRLPGRLRAYALPGVEAADGLLA
jgi:hypothetical protein